MGHEVGLCEFTGVEHPLGVTWSYHEEGAMEFTPVSCHHQLDLVRVGSLVQRVHSVPFPGVAIWGLSDHSVVPSASWSVSQGVVDNEGICLTHFAENFFPASSFWDVMSV
jgi:hypothetical protein